MKAIEDMPLTYFVIGLLMGSMIVILGVAMSFQTIKEKRIYDTIYNECVGPSKV